MKSNRKLNIVQNYVGFLGGVGGAFQDGLGLVTLIGRISSPGPGVKSKAGCSFLGPFYPMHDSVLTWRIWKPWKHLTLEQGSAG